MKIMIVAPYFYPKIGGLENYALNIAKGLQKQGHEVFVVTSNHEAKKRVEEKVEGLRVIRLAPLLKLSNTPMNPLWRWQLRKIIRTEKPDVINAHTPVPYISDMAVRAAGRTPVALTYHNDLVKASGLGKYLAKLYYVLYINKTLRKADRVIATSSYYADNSPYISKYQSKTEIVSPGVDTDRLNSTVDKTWLRKKYPGKKIVLFVGNMEKTHAHKGLDVLIKSIAETKKNIPNLQLVAVGKGDGIPGYETLAENLGIKDSVEFTGFVSDEDLPKYYAGAHAFVLPSTTNAEGFGMVLIEAQAVGTPVIGTNVGGVSRAMRDGETGRLIEPNDVIALSDAITKIVSIPRNFGANGVKFVSEHFSWSVLSYNFSSIIAELQRPTIIHVTPYYKPHIGGMEKVVESMSLELADQGWVTEVITSDIGKGASFSEVTLSNHHVDRLHSSEFAHLPIIWNLFLRLLFTPKRSIFHVHIAQAFVPEVALVAARIRRVPYIAHFHLDVAPSGKFGFIFSAYKKTLFPYMLRRADKVIVFSEDQSKLVQGKYGVKHSKVAIIPNGVAKQFYYDKPRNLDTKPRLIFVGRLTAQKNVKQLLEALEGISDKFDTTIVGDGELRKELERLSVDLRLKNVHFVGFKSWDETAQYYKMSDIFVLPSEREGMPLVLLEAMAMGLPIIATNVLGTRELIESNQNGFLVPLNNEVKLRETLLQMRSSPSKYSFISESAKIYAEKYSWSNVIMQIEQLYTEVAS